MGLDAVEMVMAVEETFGIEIKDGEAVHLQTPRQLIDFVKTKVACAQADVCLTHRSFCLVRRFMMRTIGLSRKAIAPGTTLSDLITKEHRLQFVTAFPIELGTVLAPKLERPAAIVITILGVAVATDVVPAIATHTYSPFNLFYFGVPSILVAYAGVRLTRNMRTEFPANLQTVGDLSRFVMTHKPDLATPARPGWTDEQIASRVRDIIIETLGCEKTYREDANFVKDLGLV